MSFFNKLGEKITQTSQSAAQKTKVTAETLKLKSMISDEEKCINNLYQQIGKIYYDTFGDNTDQPFVGQLIVKIKESEEKISTYEDQVKQLKGVTSCPKCGGEVQQGSPFCGSCGTALSTPEPAPVVTDVSCDKCGYTAPAGTQFCTNCGNKMKPPAEVEEPVVEEPVPAEPTIVKCSACSTELEANNAFCLNCGKKIDE